MRARACVCVRARAPGCSVPGTYRKNRCSRMKFGLGCTVRTSFSFSYLPADPPPTRVPGYSSPRLEFQEGMVPFRGALQCTYRNLGATDPGSYSTPKRSVANFGIPPARRSPPTRVPGYSALTWSSGESIAVPATLKTLALPTWEFLVWHVYGSMGLEGETCTSPVPETPSTLHYHHLKPGKGTGTNQEAAVRT